MKTFINICKSIVVGSFFAMMLVAVPASAATPLDTSCSQPGVTGSDICAAKDQKLFGAGSVWTNIINTLIYAIGAVAILMVIVGGLRYTLSAGDASATKGAKDTILYAIVGLVIAAFAYTIVNFVLSRI